MEKTCQISKKFAINENNIRETEYNCQTDVEISDKITNLTYKNVSFEAIALFCGAVSMCSLMMSFDRCQKLEQML